MLIVKILAGLAAVLVLGFASLWALGARQPSASIQKQDRVLFVALKLEDRPQEGGTDLFAGTALWRSHARFTFIGDTEAHFTDFFLLPADTDYKAGIEAAGKVADAYVAEVELLKAPGMALGLLRAQHLLGITRRPDGPLPEDVVEGLARPDVLPTLESAERTLGLPADTQVTMMNYLEYLPAPGGDKGPGRKTYQRYGLQAMKSVHAVGGQFLFAGKVSKVLVPSKAEAAPTQWDDLAAMIYPDPEAIFYMEQFEYYRDAHSYRDASLKSSKVVASVSY
ncbi:MAG: hypothetical protein AAFR64_06145 [Pseudomonadota bacterium]